MCSDINNRQNRSKSIFIQLLTLTWVAALLVSCGSNLPSTTQPTFEATESAPGPSEPATMETQEPAAPEMSSMEGDTALPEEEI